jgi:hypothetical protein
MNRAKSRLPFLLMPALIALAGGCRSYVYDLVEPPAAVQRIAGEPITVQYDPLEYHLSRQHNRLSVRIVNPTDDRIMLVGNRSYAVDPHGESHPLRGGMIAPHSHTAMLLPPEPITFPYYGWGGWGPGWGWGWAPYGPYYDPYYPGYYAPPVYYHQIATPYDWEWKTGHARLRLTYERDGKTFDHDFEIIRRPEE